MDTLRQDLAYAARSLLRARGFTAIVVATLALGIGANSAIFSVLNAVFFRPVPFPAADRIVNIAWDGGGSLQFLSSAKFEYWHDHARSFEAMATWRHAVGRMDIAGDVFTSRTIAVTTDFFQVIDIAPAIGRPFATDEYSLDRPQVAVISQATWRARFGGAPDVLGRTMRLDGEPVTVVGVLPASFEFPYEDEPIDVIVPIALTVDPEDVAENWAGIARLRPGVTFEQARAEVASLSQSFRAVYPAQASEQDRGMTVATFAELYVDRGVRHALWILMGAVTLVLLIACANVANLFLVRARRRSGEIALRAALGASRGRIARLILTESLLVAIVSGALGLLLGKWTADALVALTPAEVPRLADVGIDWRVALFTILASLVTSLFFGSAAAWPVVRTEITELLRQSTRGSSRRSPVRQGLLVVQSALSMVLLVGAGLLLVTLIGLTRVDPGFDTGGLVAVRFPTKPDRYRSPGDAWTLEQEVARRLERSPAIAGIAAAGNLPLERGVNTPMTIEGRPDAQGTVEWRAVTPSYFATLGIPLVAGRAFDDADIAQRPPVALINAAFARSYFPGEEAIGQRIDVGRFNGEYFDVSFAGPAVEIVGVVADIREASLRSEPRRTMYVPQAQATARLANVSRAMPVFIVRGRAAGAVVERALTQAFRAADPELPRPDVFPLRTVVARSLARERFGATLLATLAALALALTAFGTYGVLACTVQLRRREIGIRMALGAGGRQVRRLMLVQGLRPVAAGVLLGLASSIALSRLVAAFLWGVSPTDPVTLGAVALILLGVALAATWLPAREAARLAPLEVLAEE